MSDNTSDSSSYFGGRQPDAVIKALVWKRRDTDGEITLGLHFLELESDEVFISMMPPCAPLSSTPISCGNHVYVLGGIRKNDATFDGYDDVKDVFQLDLKDLERGWRKTTSMLFPRSLPLALAEEGKIYVFDQFGSDSFGEVYDISKDIWEPLLPLTKHIALPGPVLLDSPRSRILVHCYITKSLYGYYYDSKPRVCLNPKFCYWSNSTAIVDDVLYTFLYSYPSDFHSVRAYNVLDMKHLPCQMVIRIFSGSTKGWHSVSFGQWQVHFGLG